MSYARNGSTRIHYRTEGDGPPLVMHVGFTGTLHDWYALGFVDALKSRYRLILLDPRGHGDSGKPHDPDAHGWEDFVSDVVAVLDDAGVEQADILGYSLGGMIGYALAAQAPARMGRMIMGGASPVVIPPNREDAMMPVLLGGPAALIAVRRKRVTLPGFEDALTGMRMRMLLYCGSAADRTRTCGLRRSGWRMRGSFLCRG